MIQPSRLFDNQDPKRNRLLAALEPDDLGALLKVAKVVSLKLRKKAILQDAPTTKVYFPLTCVFSIVVTESDTPQLELATVGSEACVGAAEALAGQPAIGLHLIQLPGTALEVSAASLREVVARHPRIGRWIHRLQYALMRQILYCAACYRLHSMEERCARWLLMTHDRSGRDSFPITQEFLSHMLGVRRATVNVATGMLKKAGFIRYTRGSLTVLDRPGLESAACGCYRAIVRAYDAQLRQ